MTAHRIARTRTTRRLCLGTLAVVGLAGLGACSSTEDQVSDAIAEDAKTQLGLDTEPETSCPDDAEASEGQVFDCTVTIEGTDITVRVEFTDDTNFTFEPAGYVNDRVEAEDALAAELTAQAGEDVEVDCGDSDLLVIAEDDIATCTVSGGESTADVELTPDGEGGFTFEVVG